jgi:hypothetical protein
VVPRAGLDAVVKRKIPSPRRQSNPMTRDLKTLHLKGFEVFTGVKLQVEVFWIVTPCIVVLGYQRFIGPRCRNVCILPHHYHNPEDLDLRLVKVSLHVVSHQVEFKTLPVSY